MKLFIQFLICLSFAGIFLYKAVDDNNRLTQLRLKIPLLKRELGEIKEKNLELLYAIESFESPQKLIELAASPEYGHLHYPLQENVIVLYEKEDGP